MPTRTQSRRMRPPPTSTGPAVAAKPTEDTPVKNETIVATPDAPSSVADPRLEHARRVIETELLLAKAHYELLQAKPTPEEDELI